MSDVLVGGESTDVSAGLRSAASVGAVFPRGTTCGTRMRFSQGRAFLSVLVPVNDETDPARLHLAY